MQRLAQWPDEVPPLGPLRLGWRESMLWAQHVPPVATPMQVAAHLMAMDVPGEMLDCLPSAWPTMGPPGSFLLANPAIPPSVVDALAAREIAGEGGATVAFSPHLGGDRLAGLVACRSGAAGRRLSALCWRRDLDPGQADAVRAGLEECGMGGHVGALLSRSPHAGDLLRGAQGPVPALMENPWLPGPQIANAARFRLRHQDFSGAAMAVFQNPALPPDCVREALDLPVDRERVDARAAAVLQHARLDPGMQIRALEIVAANSRGLAAAALGRNRHLAPEVQERLGRESYIGFLALADNPWASPSVLESFANDPPVADPAMRTLARRALSRNPAIPESAAEAIARQCTGHHAANGRLCSPLRHRSIAARGDSRTREDLAGNPTLCDFEAMARLARDRSARVKAALARHPLLAYPALVARLRPLLGAGAAIEANPTAAALLPGRGTGPRAFFPAARGATPAPPGAIATEEAEPEP